MAKLVADDIRTLKILSQRSCHDDEDAPISQLSRLVYMGLAGVSGHEYMKWGGKLHTVREVCITDAGRAALSEAQEGRK